MTMMKTISLAAAGFFVIIGIALLVLAAQLPNDVPEGQLCCDEFAPGPNPKYCIKRIGRSKSSTMHDSESNSIELYNVVLYFQGSLMLVTGVIIASIEFADEEVGAPLGVLIFLVILGYLTNTGMSMGVSPIAKKTQCKYPDMTAYETMEKFGRSRFILAWCVMTFNILLLIFSVPIIWLLSRERVRLRGRRRAGISV